MLVLCVWISLITVLTNFNFIHKDNCVPTSGESSPPGTYSQHMPSRSAASGLPPHLPPLLQQTILNQEQPSEVRECVCACVGVGVRVCMRDSKQYVISVGLPN